MLMIGLEIALTPKVFLTRGSNNPKNSSIGLLYEPFKERKLKFTIMMISLIQYGNQLTLFMRSLTIISFYNRVHAIP